MSVRCPERERCRVWVPGGVCSLGFLAPAGSMETHPSGAQHATVLQVGPKQAAWCVAAEPVAAVRPAPWVAPNPWRTGISGLTRKPEPVSGCVADFRHWMASPPWAKSSAALVRPRVLVRPAVADRRAALQGIEAFGHRYVMHVYENKQDACSTRPAMSRVLLPALSQRLTQARGELRPAIVRALGALGPVAPAVPDLVPLLTNPGLGCDAAIALGPCASRSLGERCTGVLPPGTG